MENIKKLESQEQFDLLEQNIDNILNDNVYRLPLDGEYPVKPKDRKIAGIIN